MTLTVKELKKFLATIDDDRIVVLAEDAEGNGYSPLKGCWEGAYRADNTYSGDTGLETLTEEDICKGYCDQDVINDGVKALFLVPLN